MNVRMSRMIALAALALPMAHSAVAAEGSIRSRDFSVAPVVQGNGAAAPTAVEAKRVVHSREIVDATEHGGNGDTIQAVKSQRKPVRRVMDFGFGQAGADLAAMSADAQLASRAADGEGTQRN